MTNISITFSQDHPNVTGNIEAPQFHFGILELASTYKLSATKVIYPLIRESILGQIFSVLTSPANVKAKEGGL